MPAKKPKRDACYRKVKARYTRNGGTWPSAYGSGALVKCRKVGAKNWGKKSAKKKVAAAIAYAHGLAAIRAKAGSIARQAVHVAVKIAQKDLIQPVGQLWRNAKANRLSQQQKARHQPSA